MEASYLLELHKLVKLLGMRSEIPNFMFLYSSLMDLLDYEQTLVEMEMLFP